MDVDIIASISLEHQDAQRFLVVFIGDARDGDAARIFRRFGGDGISDGFIAISHLLDDFLEGVSFAAVVQGDLCSVFPVIGQDGDRDASFLEPFDDADIPFG